MPHIREVVVRAPQGGLQRGAPSLVVVTARIKFTPLEQELGISYKTRIVLFEIDNKTDVIPVYPNWQGLEFFQGERGGRDQHLGFSPAFDMTASASNPEESIEHSFSPSLPGESDGRYELRALVVCVPNTGTAMKWSKTESVPILQS